MMEQSHVEKIQASLKEFFKLFSQGRRSPTEEVNVVKAYAKILQKYQLQTIDAAMQTFITSGDVWLPSLPQVVARIESRLNRQTDRRSRVPALESADTQGKQKMREGFAKLIADLLKSQFVCVPNACYKIAAYKAGGSFDAECPLHGTGVCNETTEKGITI